MSLISMGTRHSTMGTVSHVASYVCNVIKWSFRKLITYYGPIILWKVFPWIFVVYTGSYLVITPLTIAGGFYFGCFNKGQRRKNELPSLQNRFRGSLIGAIIGDCLGAPWEFKHGKRNLNRAMLRSWLNNSCDANSGSGEKIPFDTGSHRRKRSLTRHGIWEYTDDTAMARQVAGSLIENGGCICPQDLAKRFVAEYDSAPWRGYGRSTCHVFDLLRPDLNDPSMKPFYPASQQFNGSGSFGNGAAMRVHPIALTNFKEEETLMEDAVATSRVTHGNPIAFQAAILQALAVHLSLECPQKRTTMNIADHLVNTAELNCFESSLLHAMRHVKEALTIVNIRQGYTLGNDFSALHSVPSAIFSALLVMDERNLWQKTKDFLTLVRPLDFLFPWRIIRKQYEFIKGHDFVNVDDGLKFKRVLELAISFGGDTDTIGSMAGAIAGARYGLSGIPHEMVEMCEGTKEAKEQADKLYKLTN